MARRSNKSTSTTNPTTEATNEAPESNEEAPMSETVTEESTTTESAPEAEAKPKAEADLTAFQAAVEYAVAEADETTGHVPEEPLNAVTKEFRAIDSIKGKNDAKKLVNQGLKEAMAGDDLPRARSYLQLSEDALVAASAAKGEKVPADPTEAFVQAVATLSLGYHLRTSNVPEGVSDDWQTKATALTTELSGKASEYLAWSQSDAEDRGDEPEVNSVVKNAVKLATGKSAKAGTTRGAAKAPGEGYQGERRDVAKHILNAFADKEVGAFLKIAEIGRVKSDEYGDDVPSPGAISSRLFPASGKESVMVAFGIQPDTRDGKKGAVKVSEYTEDSSES